MDDELLPMSSCLQRGWQEEVALRWHDACEATKRAALAYKVNELAVVEVGCAMALADSLWL
jgi:hypothetical protein